MPKTKLSSANETLTILSEKKPHLPPAPIIQNKTNFTFIRPEDLKFDNKSLISK